MLFAIILFIYDFLYVDSFLTQQKIIATDEGKTIYEAVDYCQEQGGRLPILTSDQEAFDFVQQSKLNYILGIFFC